METSADKEMNIEMIEKEEMVNNIRNIIRGIFEDTPEVIAVKSGIAIHSFVVFTDEEIPSRVTWASRFVIVHIPEEKPVLIEAFNESIGFQPFCRYIKDGQLVFEWNWVDPRKRFADLENSEKKGRITELQKI